MSGHHLTCFSSKKGLNLLNKIKQTYIDQQYYSVIDELENVYLIFQLNAGLLFSTSDLSNQVHIFAEIVNRIENGEKMESIPELMQFGAEKDASESDLDFARYIYQRIKREVDYHQQMIEVDEIREKNSSIHRVESTYGGIELSLFLKNDNAERLWEKTGSAERLGEYIFWHYIVPHILCISNQLECSYVYLFARDSDHDAKLIAYYESLGFKPNKMIGCCKPKYDLDCLFMVQPISCLRNNYHQKLKLQNNMPC